MVMVATVILRRLAIAFRKYGVVGALRVAARRRRARCFSLCRHCVAAAHGLEVGGPSAIFGAKGLLPVYSIAGRIDNCTFARSTIWEGEGPEDGSFRFDPARPAGRQLILEGTNLEGVADASCAFVLSSHMLEHTADPLRALAEWARVLKPGGLLILVVPHRDATFDHRRPVTTLEHLIGDFERRIGEDDLTHLPEILALHDVERDPGAGDASAFRERAARNAAVRSLHHHVFDARLALAVVRWCGMEPIALELAWPFHIVIIARKPVGGAGGPVLSSQEIAGILRRSPFPTDTRRDGESWRGDEVPR